MLVVIELALDELLRGGEIEARVAHAASHEQIDRLTNHAIGHLGVSVTETHAVDVVALADVQRQPCAQQRDLGIQVGVAGQNVEIALAGDLLEVVTAEQGTSDHAQALLGVRPHRHPAQQRIQHRLGIHIDPGICLIGIGQVVGVGPAAQTDQPCNGQDPPALAPSGANMLPELLNDLFHTTQLPADRTGAW